MAYYILSWNTCPIIHLLELLGDDESSIVDNTHGLSDSDFKGISSVAQAQGPHKEAKSLEEISKIVGVRLAENNLLQLGTKIAYHNIREIDLLSSFAGEERDFGFRKDVQGLLMKMDK